MAYAAPTIAEAEREESPEILEEKAQFLVDQIRQSKHFIAFTGAGVSTSAGIADFRGPKGAWTLTNQGKRDTIKSINTMQAIPTPSHMALVELQSRGILKYLVSQNCDGLHRRSGILPDKMSELHGNSNREYCKDCGKEYIRDFRAVATYEKSVHDHQTGRKCSLCGGTLLDTIINFGEYLPAEPLARARANAKKADLCLVLGSSLTVPPACTIPEVTGRSKKGGKLAICNLQSTPLDELSKGKLRIFCKTDDLMIRVMQKLDIPIPPFILRRRLLVKIEEEAANSRYKLTVSGVDVDGTPMSFLRSVKLASNRRPIQSEPFTMALRPDPETGTLPELSLTLEFMGHYGEPSLDILLDGGDARAVYLLSYDPMTGQWETKKEQPIEV